MAGEMYKGVFSGMSAWSNGSSSKEALRLGITAGMGEALKEGGTINKFMTTIKEGNRDLLHAMNDGVDIEMQKAAENQGMVNMLQDGLIKALKGMTSVQEILDKIKN